MQIVICIANDYSGDLIELKGCYHALFPLWERFHYPAQTVCLKRITVELIESRRKGVWNRADASKF